MPLPNFPFKLHKFTSACNSVVTEITSRNLYICSISSGFHKLYPSTKIVTPYFIYYDITGHKNVSHMGVFSVTNPPIF